MKYFWREMAEENKSCPVVGSKNYGHSMPERNINSFYLSVISF
jgi:hypothetical protein